MTLIQTLRTPFDNEAASTLGVLFSGKSHILYGEVFLDCEIADFNFGTQEFIKLRETAAQKQYWLVADHWESL